MKFIKTIKDIIKNHNLLFLVIIIFLFQIISFFFIQYSLYLYGPASIITIYIFINNSYSSYELIMGGIISIFISFILYKLIINITPKINIYLFNIFSSIIILITMILLNCVSIPAIAYTLNAPISIANNPNNYLFSYIISTFIILILCISVLIILKNTKQYLLNSDVIDLEQLEKNITN